MSNASRNADSLHRADRESPTYLRTAILLAIGVVAVAIAVAQFDREHTGRASVTPPTLPSPKARCDVAPEAAHEKAIEAECAAQAKIERYPFVPAEGLRALQRLAEAERCFYVAHDSTATLRVAERASTWRARLERDYRGHVTRYERAVASDQKRSMRLEVGQLLELLADHEGPFVARLRSEQLALDKANVSTEL